MAEAVACLRPWCSLWSDRVAERKKKRKKEQTKHCTSSLFYVCWYTFIYQTLTNQHLTCYPFSGPLPPPSQQSWKTKYTFVLCFQVWRPSLNPSSPDVGGLLRKLSIKLWYVYGDLSDHLAACFMALCVCKGKSSPLISFSEKTRKVWADPLILIVGQRELFPQSSENSRNGFPLFWPVGSEVA